MEIARSLRAEASGADERRVLVLAGSPERTRERAADALDAADIPPAATTVVGPVDFLDCERYPQSRADELLGRTRSAVVLDCHEEFRPNALGRTVGAVDGGGLLVLLTPPLDEWPERRDGFDESLAVPPFEVADVSGHFRRRVVETLRAHPGIAIVDVDADRIERDGLTDPAPRRPRRPPAAPPTRRSGRRPTRPVSPTTR